MLNTYPKVGRLFYLFAAVILLALLSGCIKGERLWSGVNNGAIFDEQDDRLDEMLEQLAKADLRVVRIWIDLRLEMDEDGNDLPVGEYNDCILDQIDNLMVKAKKKGILLLITLHQYNWIAGNSLTISQDFYEWRKCKTPVNVYQRSLKEGAQHVYDPYYQRGWGDDYLTNRHAKDAYKQRVNHILNHVNPHFGKPWKEINDVVWAWELQNEPEYLSGSTEDLWLWLNEMATYVKSVDPGTYVALGTMGWEDWGNIQDADIYTIHWYRGPDGLGDSIRRFQQEIGEPYGKLLLMEEFNPLFDMSPSGAQRRRHTPERKSQFEAIMEECRRNKVPWMFWEYGYWFDGDDIWHANKVTAVDGRPVVWPDGILWGAKVLPGAKNIWITSWAPTEKRWKVHKMVDALCSQRGADCEVGRPIYFVDTFSAGRLSSGYRWFNEASPGVRETDSYSLVNELGYLRIKAGRGQDLWAGTPAKRGSPLMLRPAPERDYWIETFVRADDPGEEVLHEPMPYPAQPINTQMGLFVFQDVDNWIFFGLTYHDFTIGDTRVQGDGLIVTKIESGVSSIVAESQILADFMFLRIERQGDNWKFYWKTKHIHGWSLLTTVNLPLTGHEVGMGVKTFDLFPQLFGPGEAYFDYFMILK